jgi:tRNA(fMet)-specific endonuclease VapC
MEKSGIMIDTSAYAAFLRGHTEIKLSLQQAEGISLNPVIIGELIAGFLRGRQENKNRAILQEFLSSARVKMVVIDEDTSERYAFISTYLRRKGTPIPTNDLWIAASAMQHGLKVLTTDKHYLEIPQVITEYYQAIT